VGKVTEAYDVVTRALDARIALATAEQKDLLADAKLALADLKTLIADQKEVIQHLNERIRQKDEFFLDKGVYWKKEDKEREQPFCSACYSRGNIVPLQKAWNGRPKNQSPWNCPEKDCKATYNPWDYRREAVVHAHKRSTFFNSDERF
jgi:hypothetical protein